MLQTFFRNIKRHKLVYSLNFFGLAIAFVPFMIIMSQVKYDFSFDKFHRDSDKLFRFERMSEGWTSWISFPMAESFISSSPNIESGAVIYPACDPKYLTTENSQGKVTFLEDMIPATPDITKVVDFIFTDGAAQEFYQPQTALIPYSMAQTIYGNESPVGKLFTLDNMAFGCSGLSFTIVGVYKDFPANSQLRNGLYLNLNDRHDYINTRSKCNFNVYVRLNSLVNKESVERSFEQSEQKVDQRAETVRLHNIADIYFDHNYSNDPYSIKGNMVTTITILSVALLIILIAIINFTNFSMALVPFRIKEINIKKVHGSSVGALRWELVCDAMMTTFVSFLLSVGITSIVASSSLRNLVVADFSLADNPMLYVWTALLSLVVGLVAGLYPARYTTSFPPALVLKGSFGLSPKGRQLRRVLISVQFVIAFVLIVSALLIHKQNAYMCKADLGMDRDNVAVITMSAQDSVELTSIDTRLKAIPEVLDIAYASDKICAGDQYQNWGLSGIGQNKEYFQSTVILVSWNFLSVMNIPIIQGREPLLSDEKKEGLMFIVNRYIAENEGVTPGVKPWAEIVGVYENVQIFSMREKMGDISFKIINEDFHEACKYGYVRLSPGTDLDRAVTDIREAYAEIDPLLPLEIEFFDSILDTQYKSEIQLEKTINWFSLLAVLISIIGIFGVIFFDTQQRKKEMAVRRILGAEEKDLLWIFNRSYLIILVICFAIAVPVIFFFTNMWLKNFAYHTHLTLALFALSFIVVTLITIITINIQAISAVRQNPSISIKSE